ncbi:MAG: alanine--tRNA ligase [Bacteroidota bacterium]|nr:alanine--tRNA ligase [Candidatus Kapabacteria bacterium]MDW8219510.1 alanine--tRNA ligase [Bacteroidota bacterium]
MTSREIRQSFLDFFASKQHRIVPSAPVIPHGDPTLLFTNAGMNQFKDVFLGKGKRDYVRAADTQKCIRVSGKHNDLEEVGYDTYHHTFFEMLGNWSFGDYYKAEAIEWAWELLVKVWKLEPERLHATVYKTDEEAAKLWERYLPRERIHYFGEKDNFWEMGETGPCGPCSEIHYDRTPDLSGGKLVNAGAPDVIEIWNLVFIQYNRTADGTLEELPAKHVDTGMGFERICAVINGKVSNYDTDVFTPLLDAIAAMSGHKYSGALDDMYAIAMRVMADHIRTVSFSIADGALPGNEGRGYVLRRILRRASRYSRNLGFREPVLYKLVQTLADTMGDVFPEIREQQKTVERVIQAEEEAFLQTLERGLEKFDDIARRMESHGLQRISGADAFLLYDTFGFPLDLTQLLARERRMVVDDTEFATLMEQQRERSRKARKIALQEVETLAISSQTEFTGYTELQTEATVLHVHGNQIVLDRTPFYAEMGGQVADKGMITLGGISYTVLDVQKSGNAIVHICDRDVEPLVGTKALATVDKRYRADVAANHSATHLLHEALRRVLGTHVQQAGSLVAAEGLRFDFPHFQKVSPEEIQAIEEMVNEKVRENIPVRTLELPIDEARKIPGVKSFFGDKYGDTVRVVVIDDTFSAEFCGGTHVRSTSEIGVFKIVAESSIAAGTRRLEAITGTGVLHYIAQLQQRINEQQRSYEELQQKLKQLEKELSKVQVHALTQQVQGFLAKARLANGGHLRVVAEQVDVAHIDQLKALGDELRNALGKQGVGLLASVVEGKVQLVCVATDDVKERYPAGKIVAALAKELGGGGGGKSHLATAGGKDIHKLPSMLQDFAAFVEKF